MEEFFGKIGPGLIVMVISGIVQYVKVRKGWEDDQVDIFALAFYYVLFVPFSIIVTYMTEPPASVWEIAFLVYASLFYPLLAWLMGVGFYTKVIKPYERMVELRAMRRSKK